MKTSIAWHFRISSNGSPEIRRDSQLNFSVIPWILSVLIPDSSNRIPYLLLESFYQLAVGVYKGLLGFDFCDDGLLRFEFRQGNEIGSQRLCIDGL